ncbi:MAG: carbohydrate-binding family 9-like protein, partial [Oscillospiraceae bacterium]|nr:carbohydrate-binding family 9-like protein [Oscillospiraceae bacterium]
MERLYEISRIKEKQFNWSNIPEIPIDNVLWEPDCYVRAFARLCYDDEALYVSLRAVEAQIRAEYTAPLSPVHRDSCLEFFFMPERGDRYFNFEVNPNGCMHIGFGHNRADRVILARRDDMEFFCIKPERTP